MKHEINFFLTGLGVIIYSPFATDQINDGEDYLTSNFWQPEKVAEHVNACRISRARGTLVSCVSCVSCYF